MTKIVYSLLLLFICLPAIAQRKRTSATQASGNVVATIPLQPDHWNFKPQTVEFTEYRSRPAMKILPNAGQVVLKSFDFTDGTIEFDYDPLDQRFAAFYFHYQDANETECFYFRTKKAGYIDAVQYAPFIKGVNLWDMLFHYQTSASFTREQWNHVKLVISGQQMRVYVNSNTRPTLAVPRLEGDVTHGTLAFDGESAISNLVVKPGQVEGLDNHPGIDPTDSDPRYLRNWEVSTPIDSMPKVDFHYDWIPNKETKWEPLAAERNGLVNLTRRFGKSNTRRFVWIRTTIEALTATTKKLQLGFSDDVVIMINGKPLYFDKNPYGTPAAKDPAGRCTIENASISVPLQAGSNQLLIGVGNSFYGWGIVARLDSPGGN